MDPPRANRLLQTLDEADFALIAPHLQRVSLAQGQVLQEQEARVEEVYFPLRGWSRSFP
jgi:CRP-like cAMP-binding protein